MSSYYWSSTTNANNNDNAWCVNFNNGNVNNNNKTNAYAVRAVRGGKCALLSFESVFRAYLDCRRRKRGTINAIRFEYDLLDNLFELTLSLQRGTYRPSRSVCFVTTAPKLREIFAADFRDRVVHHLMVRELEKIWEPRFIHDSFACRQGKGAHAAVERLQSFMRKATKNGQRAAYALQLDIRSFFMNIDKSILFSILSAGLKSEVLVWLLRVIIFHDCTSDFVFKGDSRLLEKVPKHKSLFHAPPDKGLPIGNLSSQFFANVYLNELDQFVKHRLKCRFYLRYVDDFILISDDPVQLGAWSEEIKAFLEERLALAVKEEGKIRRVSEGIDFLGYIIRRPYILSRRRVVNNLKEKLETIRKRAVSSLTFGARTVKGVHADPETTAAIRQTLASYLGHFSHANTFRLVNRLFEKHDWLLEFFIYTNGKLYNRLQIRTVFQSMKLQVSFFRARLQGFLLLICVGKFVELYDEDAEEASRRFHLRLRENVRRMKAVAGFPLYQKDRYLNALLAAGRNVAVIEEGQPGRFVRERYVKTIYRQLECVG